MLALKTQKKRSNAKTKMAEYQKRARAGLRGLTLIWSDSDPFNDDGHITETNVTHKNPIQKIIVKDMWYRCSQWILNTEFTWLVTMSVFFETEKRGTRIDEYEFRYTCTLRGDKSQTLNDAMEDALNESITANNSYPAGHKNKGVYKVCKFNSEIVGV